MPDLPTCAHDVTLPPPGQESFCPLCLRAKLAEAEAEAARLAAVAQGRAEQLERVALYLGHVARHGPDGDRTIAGLAIQELARLGVALAESEAEITRLKAGCFTPEELQGLCHNLSADDACAFVQGCRAYQLQLFGRDKVKATLDRLYEEWMERNRCRDCGAYPDPSGQVDHFRQCSKWETQVEELAP